MSPAFLQSFASVRAEGRSATEHVPSQSGSTDSEFYDPFDETLKGAISGQQGSPEGGRGRIDAFGEPALHSKAGLDVVARAFRQANPKAHSFIAVMGLTGTGKSSFIRLLTNSDVTISHSLAACTAEVGVYSFETSGGHLVTLIDTPGFDDTHRSDTEILQDVAYFLSEVYSQELKLAGIIYLHRIFDTKMGGSALRNLNMFQALCGETGMSHVVLATTMWDKLQSVEAFEEGERKEAELRSDYWADMLKFGSQTFRHNNTRDCALRIINHILSLSGKAVLKIQREMIDDKCRLDQTQAGQQLQKELLEQNAKHERQLQQAQQYHEAAIRAGNQKLIEVMAEHERDHRVRLEQYTLDREERERVLRQDFTKMQQDLENKWKHELEKQSKEKYAAIQALQLKEREIDIRMEDMRQTSEKSRKKWVLAGKIVTGLTGVAVLTAGVIIAEPTSMAAGASMLAGTLPC